MKLQTIYYGDNLPILRDFDLKSVDLIYLDPPFFSQRNRGAYKDRWRSARSYINYMRPRMEELYRVLRVGSSLYLHCDTNASHYIKVMLDEIFGIQNFQNEIIWSYRRRGSKTNHFQRMHDIILFYSKLTKPRIFNTILRPPTYSTSENWMHRRRKAALHGIEIPEIKEIPLDDVWSIPILSPIDGERVGYPTQKPLALLKRIIKVSSNQGDIVLDPFCGCGTTLHAAKKLGRKWIGIDCNAEAIVICKKRLGIVD